MNPSNCLACLVNSGLANFTIRGAMPFVCTCDPPVEEIKVLDRVFSDETLCSSLEEITIVDDITISKGIEVAAEIGFEGTSSIIVFPSFFYFPGDYLTEDDMWIAVNEHFRENFDIFGLRDY